MTSDIIIIFESTKPVKSRSQYCKRKQNTNRRHILQTNLNKLRKQIKTIWKNKTTFMRVEFLVGGI